MKPSKRAEPTIVQVPRMYSKKKDVINFLKVCMNEQEDIIEELLEHAESKKQFIIDTLEDLKADSQLTGDKWRMIAFSRALKEIKNVTVPIVSGKQAMNLKGIGKKISKIIDLVLSKGRSLTKEEIDEYEN